MVYKIDDKTFNDASRAAEYITENMSDDYYDNMLNDTYGDVNICGCDYSASIALFRVDETAYNCGRCDYNDSLSYDISYEIDRMSDDETEDFYGFTVEAFDDESAKEEINDCKEQIDDLKAELEDEVQGIGDEAELATIRQSYKAQISNLEEEINDIKERMSEFGVTSE